MDGECKVLLFFYFGGKNNLLVNMSAEAAIIVCG